MSASQLSRAFRYVHRHYTGYINARLRVTGAAKGRSGAAYWPPSRPASPISPRAMLGAPRRLEAEEYAFTE